MSGAHSSKRGTLRLSAKLASRSIHPGERTVGRLTLSADEAVRVVALRVVPMMTRRELREREVSATELAVSMGAQLGAYSVAAGAIREIPFALTWPQDLASSVPNQLDYDLVATAVLDEGEVESRSRVLVLPSESGAVATLPIGPDWLQVGAECEAETDEGRWLPARIEGVLGLTALVRWEVGAEAEWLPARRVRARPDR